MTSINEIEDLHYASSTRHPLRGRSSGPLGVGVASFSTSASGFLSWLRIRYCDCGFFWCATAAANQVNTAVVVIIHLYFTEKK